MDESVADFEVTRNLRRRHDQMIKAIGKQVQEGTKMMKGGMKMFQVESNKERAEKVHRKKQADLDRQNQMKQALQDWKEK